MTNQEQIAEAIASAESLFNTPESQEFSRRMQFEDYINDAYPTVTICGQVFFPSDILRECDPVAFRVYQSDFESEIE